MMKSIIQTLFNKEIGVINEKYRKYFTIYALLVSTFLTIGTLYSLHFYNGVTIYYDSGSQTLIHIQQMLEHIDSTPVLYYGVIAWLAFFVWYRGYIAYKSYSTYEQYTGKKIDLTEMATIAGVNVINMLSTPLVVIITLFIASSLGVKDFNVFLSLIALAESWIEYIPTLFPLSSGLAFLATWLLITFMHYWLHRLAHTRRFLWLLLHRPHHLTSNLSNVTVAPVVFSFPFWILMLLPYTFLFGAAGKLFAPEPLYLEFVVFQMFWMLIQTWAHNAAMYEVGIKKPWLVFMSNFSCDGVYHVLHHSRATETQRLVNNNNVNFGTGSLFACWDRLFGTYQPLVDKLPPMGLSGEGKLKMNPLLLACAGVFQLAYELYHNKNYKTRWKILTGKSTYSPPITKDFAVDISFVQTSDT